ncbi:MAG: efflux RND transporter periplasmic adaptor subunit, partial [Nitrospirae bacterium]
MHPQIVRDEPGRCPICGMDLVPVGPPEPHPEEEAGRRPAVAVAAGLVERLGIRTAPAVVRDLERRIETVGYVEYDRDRLTHVYAPDEGNIEGLTVTSEGERVKRGQLLFKLDSPTLSTYFDETYADRDGVVASLNVIEGTFVRPTDVVLTIADLASVWVVAEVFESQAAWVRRGQRAVVRVPYLAGRRWEGKVAYVYPELDPETRTLKVRMRLDNPDEALKPNMQAEITLFAEPRKQVLAIPREALIETGKEQRVVVSGQFLLDSESNLEAGLLRLAPPEERGEAEQ